MLRYAGVHFPFFTEAAHGLGHSEGEERKCEQFVVKLEVALVRRRGDEVSHEHDQSG